MSDEARDDVLATGLRRALALDDDELAFLREANLPQRLVALAAHAQRSRAALALELLWVILPVLAGYVGWLIAVPVLAEWLDTARQAGLTSVLATLLTRGAWGVMELFASLVEAASTLPGFDAPLTAVALLAAAAYAVAAGTPFVRRRPVAV
jgi:hypothetical protein